MTTSRQRNSAREIGGAEGQRLDEFRHDVDADVAVKRQVSPLDPAQVAAWGIDERPYAVPDEKRRKRITQVLGVLQARALDRAGLLVTPAVQSAHPAEDERAPT